jgi:hypothetical protein
MAKSKFSDIYKQELNSKGVMSSLGSAALKQTRERMDIRNSLFGGTGAISRTGQKIFGKGYSAMGGNAAKLSGRSNSPIQGASLDALVISNQKQERLLKIVAKNTMNMNMMARDMNITRQNIVSLTRKVTGKSAKGSDAMYMNANRRNAQVDGMPKRGAAPGASGGIMSSIFGGIGSVLSGGAGIIGSVVSGLLGVVGGVGGGILSAIGGILGGIPGGWLLGTIALAGIAYLLKEVAANTDFKGLKDDILKGLGFDPGTSFSQQLLVKMGFTEATSKNIVKTLSNFSDNMYNYFVPILNKIGKGFAVIIDTSEIYLKASFELLSDSFSKVGEKFGLELTNFFGDNKLALIAVVGAGVAAAFLPKAAGGALLAAAAAAAALSNPATFTDERYMTDKQLEEGIKNKKGKGLSEGYDFEKAKLDKATAEKNETAKANAQARMDSILRDVESYRAEQIRRKKIYEPSKSMKDRVENDPDYKNRGSKFVPLELIETGADESVSGKAIVSSNSPTRTNSQIENAKIIYKKFREAGYSDTQAKAAIANALAESQLDATKQSDVIDRTTGKREQSYGLFQINRIAHPEYSIETLTDPEKNTDAMLRNMRIKYPAEDNLFRKMTDQDKATEQFMRKFEIPLDQSAPKIQERVRRIPEVDKLLKDSEQRPVSVINNNITNVASSSRGNQYPSAYNFDGEMFYKQAFSTANA